MRSIELPNSFTDIPKGLFSYSDFQYIKLGNNVKTIGSNAFGSSDPVIEIGTATPPTIASDAFPNVEYLSDITVIVPNAKAETAYRKATVWEEMTYSNQNNISEVTVDTPGDLSFELITECNMMPAKVVGLKVNGTINADDFNQMLVNMKSLLRLDLSECNITEIPSGALTGKRQLHSLTLPTNLQTIGTSAFQNCTFLTELIMNDGVQTIGSNAFWGCISLTEVTMSENLKAIESDAFRDCTSLTVVYMPTAPQTIGSRAFQGCTSLEDITLNNGLQTIENNAFYGCNKLTGELSLPSSVTGIGSEAFVGTAYTSVRMPYSLKTIGDFAFYELPIAGRLVLPSRLTSIGSHAFANSKITELVIQDGVKSIGDNAFYNTPIQGHVTIPDGVTYLGREAFAHSQLSSVFLPNTIESLPERLFYGCPNLDRVYVPYNYIEIASAAFSGCGSLRTLRLSANLKTMGEYALSNTPIEYLRIPSQMEVLPNGVLRDCNSLESLTLPASLTSVEGEALTGCTALRNMSVEALTPPAIRGRSAIRGINTDKCLISIPTSAYRNYVLAEYWGQFVQMRNDIAVETAGNGEIAFESVEEEEEYEEVAEARAFNLTPSIRRAARRAPGLASDEESMTYANNGSSVYVPQQGKVRFYIIPGDGEELVSATLDGEDIMPYIVDNVYTATADKKNAKLVVKFSGTGQGSVVLIGDSNNDGEVDIADAVQIVNYVVGKATPAFNEKAADVNNDGVVDIADAVRIVNLVVGKIDVLATQFHFNGYDPE